MSQVHTYLAVQRLNLSDANWNTLIAAMQAKGEANQGGQPSERNHWRPSLDGTIWIFEALFESSNVDEQWFIDWAAGVFGVDPSLVTTSTGYNSYGRFSTFTYQAINRMRIGVFGFVSGQGWPAWADSRTAARQYIIDNAAVWEA